MMPRITGGSNLAFYASTALILYLSWCNRSVVPILCWIGFLAVSIPMSLWLARRDELENARIADEFPHDPIIQAKYGRKSNEAQERNVA